MKLTLLRDEKTPDHTFGKLLVNGEYECDIIEDAIRPVKVHGETCIPAGKYKIIISYSPRFAQQMPLLLNVPGFSGIRIHPGNTATDTEGCLLPGTKRGTLNGKAAVLNSRAAYNRLYRKLVAASKTEEITIVIE